MVKIDPFHFIQRIADSSWGKRHPAYGPFVHAVRDAIFAVYPEDKVSSVVVGWCGILLRDCL